MNTFCFFTYLYSHLTPKRYIPNSLISPFRYITRLMADVILSRTLKNISPSYNYERKDVIVSLTSYPARILNLWKVIKSLKLQDVRPGKIILYLSKGQFCSIKDIPSVLLDEQDDLFSIVFVDDDLKSHKKYYYSIKNNPNNTIITVDDDIIYHPKMLSSLIETADKYPGCIIANIATSMTYNNGVLNPYVNWKNCEIPYDSNNLVQIGAGGVLYPPNCLDGEVFNIEAIKGIAPLADDLWLNAMARISHTPIIKSNRNFLFLPIFDNTESLSDRNVGQGNNDIQIAGIRGYMMKNRGIDIFDVCIYEI